MADRKNRYVISDLSGGRNGTDPSWAIAENQCQDAVNVDFYRSTLGNKRSGATTVTGASTAFTSATMSFLFRHVPGTSEGDAELWGANEAIPPEFFVLRTGVAWSAITAGITPTGNIYDWNAASLNGVMALAQRVTVDRLSFASGTTVRVAGVTQPAVVTATNNGAGTYAATTRYYRERYTVQSGGVTLRRSEPSTSVSFTPSATGTSARITKGAASSLDNETHWEIEASTDNTSFYRIATLAVGTTIYDDSALITTYNSNPLSALTGTYTTQKNYKFVASDQNRVLGFGNWTTTNKQNRVEFSAVVGSLDVGDVERVDTTSTYFIDLDDLDSGFATGLKGPIYGCFLAFKNRQFWLLTPTGNSSQPYRADAIDKTLGALCHQCITMGSDRQGNPAAYFMSHRGPYRWSRSGGLEYIGRGIEDLILGPTSTINLSATHVPACAIHYPDKRQVWFWWATSTNNDPNMMAIYDIITGGWSRIVDGDLIGMVRTATLFANTLGSSMSSDLKPYVGQWGGKGRIWKADTGTSDAGTNYQAYVVTKDFEPGGPGFEGEVGDAMLLAKASTGVTITDTVTPDFGLSGGASGTASLTASGSESRVLVRLEGSGLNGVKFVRHQIGDATAAANSWTLDRLVVPFVKHDPTSA